jgi:hypothetical protein
VAARAKTRAQGKSKARSRRPKTARKSKPAIATPAKAVEPKPIEAVATPAPPPAVIAEVGAPPADDPLAMQAWMHKMLVASMSDIAKDKDLSPRERRKELRTTAAAAAKLMPRARLQHAEQLVLKQLADLEQKQRDRRGAKLEKLPRPAPPAPALEPDGEEPRQ